MANKAGIIPSGNEQDMVARIAMEAAKGNEALARLYISLLHRYQERLASQEFRSSERAIDRDERRSLMYEREDLIRGRNKPDPNAPNPMGSPGAGGDPRRQATPAAPAAAPTQQVPPAYRPAPSIPGSSDIPGSQQFKPQGSDSKKFSHLTGVDAFAQAPGARDTDFSAQAKVNQTAPGGSATRPRTTLRPPEQLPREPSRKTRMAEFLPIRREWLDLMAAEEKKHGLPQGTLLVAYGMENGGGKVMGNDPNRPYGLFMFTKQLRQQYGIDDQSTMNPAVMIPAAARNMRENANEYKRVTGKDMPNTNEYIPHWIMLHQWGKGDGPRMVHAALSDAGHMPAAKVMLTNPGGRQRNNNAVLSQNNLDSNSTIFDVVKNTTTRAAPFHNAALRIVSDPDAYSAADDEAPRPPGGMSMRGSEGLNPQFQQRLQALMDKAPPEIRSQVRIGSGYRSVEHQRELWQRAVRRYGSPAAARRWVAPPGGSEHGRRNAADLVYDSPEARKWVHANAPSVGLKFPMSHEPWHIEVSETRQGPKFTAPLPTRVATVPAAAAATTTAAAAAPAPQPAQQPYVATPAEGTGKGKDTKLPDPRLFTMFGIPQSAPITDEMPRSFGAPAYRPIPRASQPAAAWQGPQQAAPTRPPVMATPTTAEFDSGKPSGMPGAPELPNLPPPVEETIPSSIQRPPQGLPPTEPDAVAAPSSEVGPPVDWSAPSSIPSIRMTGSPDEQIQRNMNATLPSWEYADAPEQQASSPIPSISMSGDPYSAATQRAQSAQAGREFPFPEDVPPSTQLAQTPEDVVVAQTARETSPQRPNAATEPEVQAAPVDATNWMNDPGSRASRQYRSEQRGQFVSDTIAKTPAALAAIRDAIFKGGELNAEMQRPENAVSGVRNLTGAIGSAVTSGNPFDPGMPERTQRGAAEAWRIIQEAIAAGKGVSTTGVQQPSVQAPQLPSGIQSSMQSIVDAIKQKGEEYRNRAYGPKSVKTIDPTKPDPTSTKPNAAPTAPKDEPIVLTPKPGAPYVPFQNPAGTTPQSGPQAPPMARKPQAMLESGDSTAGISFQRVGPGQFIAVLDDDMAQDEEQQVA